jgi:hypothetical protein
VFEMKCVEVLYPQHGVFFVCLCVQVLERKKALQKHRALVSYYEQKCRRIRKIKSKKSV